MKIPKRFLDRAKSNLRRYQRILESAKARDVNESDTAVVVSDFLQDVLGYDKYEEITTEFAIRSTFCDLAITLGGTVRYLIEVKSIGTDLRENHLRQAIDYAANQGVEWVLLTNGARWQAHRLRFEQPIAHDEVFSVDLLDPSCRPAELLQLLYLISRESATGNDLEGYYRHKEASSRYVVAQILLTEPVLAAVRRQLRGLFDGLKISEEEIADLLKSEVVKREALEGEKASAASARVRRAARKRERSATSRTPRANGGDSAGAAAAAVPAAAVGTE